MTQILFTVYIDVLQFGNRENYYTSVLRESQLIRKELAQIRIQAEFSEFLSMIFSEILSKASWCTILH